MIGYQEMFLERLQKKRKRKRKEKDFYLKCDQWNLYI